MLHPVLLFFLGRGAGQSHLGRGGEILLKPAQGLPHHALNVPGLLQLLDGLLVACLHLARERLDPGSLRPEGLRLELHPRLQVEEPREGAGDFLEGRGPGLGRGRRGCRCRLRLRLPNARLQEEAVLERLGGFGALLRGRRRAFQVSRPHKFPKKLPASAAVLVEDCRVACPQLPPVLLTPHGQVVPAPLEALREPPQTRVGAESRHCELEEDDPQAVDVEELRGVASPEDARRGERHGRGLRGNVRGVHGEHELLGRAV